MFDGLLTRVVYRKGGVLVSQARIQAGGRRDGVNAFFVGWFDNQGRILGEEWGFLFLAVC